MKEAHKVKIPVDWKKRTSNIYIFLKLKKYGESLSTKDQNKINSKRSDILLHILFKV